VATVADFAVPGAQFARPAIGADATAFSQYTSGSTGDPKGVVISHANLLANVRAMWRASRIDSADTFLSWLPLYHDLGLIGACIRQSLRGVSAGVDVAARIPRPALALVVGHPPPSGHRVGSAELRLRAVPEQAVDADLDGLDLGLLASGFQRRRAG
jgi:hypothetical protein